MDRIEAIHTAARRYCMERTELLRASAVEVARTPISDKRHPEIKTDQKRLAVSDIWRRCRSVEVEPVDPVAHLDDACVRRRGSVQQGRDQQLAGLRPVRPVIVTTRTALLQARAQPRGDRPG